MSTRKVRVTKPRLRRKCGRSAQKERMPRPPTRRTDSAAPDAARWAYGASCCPASGSRPVRAKESPLTPAAPFVPHLVTTAATLRLAALQDYSPAGRSPDRTGCERRDLAQGELIYLRLTMSQSRLRLRPPLGVWVISGSIPAALSVSSTLTVPCWNPRMISPSACSFFANPSWDA